MIEYFHPLTLAALSLAVALVAVIVRLPRVGRKVRIGNIPYQKKVHVYEREDGKQYSLIGERSHVEVKLWPNGKDFAQIGGPEKFDPLEKVLLIK